MISSLILPTLRRRMISARSASSTLRRRPLVGVGLLVDRPVVLVVEARREAPDAEVVHAAHAVGGVVAHPVLAAQLLDPVQGGARGQDARLGLALLEVAVVLDVEDLDEASAA